MAAALRVFLIALALIGFFLVVAPVQWVVARRSPAAAHQIPLFFCRTLLRLIRTEVVVVGQRAEAGPVIIAPNHVSWIDILALGSLAPFCFLAKSDVAAWPLLSAFAKVQGTVFVDRRRKRTIPRANREMAARLIEGRQVLMFPEGTTVRPPEPGRFLSSHFAAARDCLAALEGAGTGTNTDWDGVRDARAVRIQPVAITYSSGAAAWVDDDDLLSHLWRTLRSPPLRCVVRFGEPLVCRGGFDRKCVARETREAIVGMLGHWIDKPCTVTPSVRTAPEHDGRMAARIG